MVTELLGRRKSGSIRYVKLRRTLGRNVMDRIKSRGISKKDKKSIIKRFEHMERMCKGRLTKRIYKAEVCLTRRGVNLRELS